MEFRILGPLEVLDDGGEISIRGRKLQALLALLLLHAPEMVSRDRLVDELWGDDPPATAAKTLQVHVSRLRRELGDIVVSRGGGYLIRIEPGALDLEHFERLVAEGRTAMAEEQPERASERLREALALWRGPPLPELADEPFARIEIGRLEEERLDAIEERLEADLALGLHSDVTPELESLVARNPYRERLRALLMLSLYRAGRQADALAAYQSARTVLVEELGLEPGVRLRELHGAILAQDPTLDRATVDGTPEPHAVEPEPPRARGWVFAAMAAAALGLAALLFAAISGGDDSSRSSPLSDDSHAVAVIDPATNRVTTAASVGAVPGPLAFEPRSRSLWVGNVRDKSVTRIDLDPVRTGPTIAIGEPPLGLAAADGAVWVVGSARTKPYVVARRIDSRFDAARSPVEIQTLPRDTRASATIGAGSLWVAPSFGRLTPLDPVDGRKLGPGVDAVSTPSTIAAGEGQLWVGDSTAGVVASVDPSTGIAKTVTVAGHPVDIAIGSRSVWVTLALEDAVARIDRETGSVRSTTEVGRGPNGIAVGAGAVWVANSGDGSVSKLDPRSGEVTDTIAIGGSPQDVVVAEDRVWVTVRPGSREIQERPGGTITWETQDKIDFLDPALAYSPESIGVLHPTCAKLLTYPSEPGPAGTRPVPELAEALPSRSADSRAYTFTIRRGYRFSPPSGEPVTARSMKYTIERTLNPRMTSFWAPHLDDLVGRAAFAEGRARHIAGIVARGNRLTLRLTRPSATLPERVALPAFCAVPLGTPIDPDGLPSVPSAGPYYVAEQVPGQEVVLRRNPAYGGSRRGHPDEIRLTMNGGKGTVARVERGAVDYTQITERLSTARRLDARYGAASPAAQAGRQRYFVKPMPELDAITFNTSRPAFSSARLRRAVNYAIDRRALAQQGLWNGMPARPTDQYVPPTLQGFRDVRIYPMRPDLARARALAGPRRRSVVLYTGGYPSHVRMAEIVRTNLRRIGIDVRIKNLGDRIFARLARRDEPFDMAFTGWYADYPNPIDFLRQLDGRTIRAGDNINLAYFNDPGYNGKLDAATALLPPAREIALGRLDVHMARTAAPWAAIANDRTHDFFSDQVGCQRWNAIFGLDLSSLCIRSGA